MRKIRRILVAVKDPRAPTLPSIGKAAQLARATGAEVELFQGLDTPLYVDGAGSKGFRNFSRDLRARALNALEALAARMRKHGVQVTTAADWDFPAHEAIIRRARRTGADLIVAECAPGRHLAPMFLRLTDWELLRFSQVPLLIVKSPRFYRHPAILAAIDPLHEHAKPTRLDDEILRHAAAFEDALHGTLNVVHAYAPMAVGTPADLLLNAASSRQAMQNSKSAAQQRMDRALSGMDIARSRRYLIGKHPHDAIQEAARRTASAIVVMGAVSRSGLKSLFIGNTAEQLLDELTCDVLVVKPHRFAGRVAPARRGMRLIEPRQSFPPFG